MIEKEKGLKSPDLPSLKIKPFPGYNPKSEIPVIECAIPFHLLTALTASVNRIQLRFVNTLPHFYKKV
jgi:hypothetical protein